MAMSEKGQRPVAVAATKGMSLGHDLEALAGSGQIVQHGEEGKKIWVQRRGRTGRHGAAWGHLRVKSQGQASDEGGLPGGWWGPCL